MFFVVQFSGHVKGDLKSQQVHKILIDITAKINNEYRMHQYKIAYHCDHNVSEIFNVTKRKRKKKPKNHIPVTFERQANILFLFLFYIGKQNNRTSNQKLFGSFWR